MGRSRRSLLTVIPVAFGGCVTSTDPTGPPDYATCDPSAVMTPPSGGREAPPTELTPERVSEYVTTLEEDIMLPPKDERTDGWINLEAPTIESVAHGYIVYLPVLGGYYNEAVGDSTATQHADLPEYTASYFVNKRVVRRAAEIDRVDPRESGEVVVCQAE